MKYKFSSFISRLIGSTKGYSLVATMIFISLLSGCSPMNTSRSDPLIEKIYISANQQQITYPELLEKIVTADVIYLGENHNNETHHRHQMTIIKDLLDQGKRPVIGFEFFSVDQTGHLMSFVSSQAPKHPGSIDHKIEERLRENLGWQNRPDSTWQFYFQIIKLAYENKLTVFGADLPSGIVRRITRSGSKKLTEIEKEFLKTTKFEDDTYRELMFQKFKASHCGFAHQKMMVKMYATWLARNDAMAFSIAKMQAANPKQPIVMILGKGHVEHNMAVYDRVHHRLPDLSQLNLGFIEISIAPSDLQAYFQPTKIANKTFLYDHEYVWFTQRTSYEDPCLKFREQLKKMREAGHKLK